jgi:hypothetical protein
LEQARKRLLSQFEDMGTDSKRAAVEWLAKHSSGFKSDRDDAESYYESAYDAGIEHYELLNGMRARPGLVSLLDYSTTGKSSCVIGWLKKLGIPMGVRMLQIKSGKQILARLLI